MQMCEKVEKRQHTAELTVTRRIASRVQEMSSTGHESPIGDELSQ